MVDVKYIIIFLLLIGFISCIKENSNASHKLEYPLQFTIRTGANPNLTHVYEWNVNSDWLNFLSRNNLTADQISEIKPRSFRISTPFNTPTNYDFIENARIKIAEVTTPNTRIQIADLFNEISNRNQDLFITPGLASLNKFIMDDVFILSLELRYRGLIVADLEHRLYANFDIYLK